MNQQLAVSLSEDLPIGPDRIMEKGRWFCGTTALAGMLLSDTRSIQCSDGKIRPLQRLVSVKDVTLPKFDPELDWNEPDRKIFLIRNGGFGDILFLSCVIVRILQIWNKAKIILCAGEGMKGVLNGLPIAGAGVPVPLDVINPDRDAVVHFDGIIEGSPDAQSKHAIDLFCEWVGIGKLYDEERKCFYRVSKDEAEAAAKRFPKPPKTKRIAIQMQASALVRSWPESLSSIVMDYFAAMPMTQVILLGRHGSIVCRNPKVLNLAAEEVQPALSFRESCAVLSQCDVLIAPDSSLLHVAGAIDMPAIAIYGPFPAELRVLSKKCRVIQGHGMCAPCFYHATKATDLPQGRGCTAAGMCTVLASIPPEAVIRETLEALKDG